MWIDRRHAWKHVSLFYTYNCMCVLHAGMHVE